MPWTLNDKHKIEEKLTPSSPPKLSALDRRTFGNFQHWSHSAIKARKNSEVIFNQPVLFAYLYLTHCAHAWDKNYTTSLEKMFLIPNSKTNFLRIITCFPFTACTELLCIANKVLNVTDIYDRIIELFMHGYMHDNVPNSFQIFIQIDGNMAWLWYTYCRGDLCTHWKIRYQVA